jgi:sulfane dehydrogenase subunit SoxC
LSTTPIPTIDDRLQRTIDGMIAAEARHLSQRATEEEECECKDGMFPSREPTNRRNFLFAAGSTAGAAAAALVAGSAAAQQAPAGAKHFDVPADPTKEQGRPVAADGGYCKRYQLETQLRVRIPTPKEKN